MKYDNLPEKLKDYDIDPVDVIDIHVHIPDLSDDTKKLLLNQPHSLIPADVVSETFGDLNLGSFKKKFGNILGACALLPVEEHNIFGKACPVYCSNTTVLKYARQFPEFIIPFGSINLQEKNISDRLKELKKSGIIGIKYHALEGYALSACYPALAALEELQMPLVVHTGDTPFQHVDLNHANPKMLIPIANDFPKLNILITHFATPLHNEAFWIASRYDNIFMDTAEYPIYWTNHPLNPYGPLLSPLNTKRVGIHKFIFGTDYPMPTLVQDEKKIKNVSHHIGYYLNSLLDLPEEYLTPEEKKQIITQNVWSFLGKSRNDIIEGNKKIQI